MDNNTILHCYQDWLKVQKMPAGKKKTLSAAVELF
ncbi:TetR/AcrR family transcriptional regulator, partial [Lactococcus raffinolactis]|nr:TetR/AcrR family transcriptional regulator [Lactococcus raffinolactis]